MEACGLPAQSAAEAKTTADSGNVGALDVRHRGNVTTSAANACPTDRTRRPTGDFDGLLAFMAAVPTR